MEILTDIEALLHEDYKWSEFTENIQAKDPVTIQCRWALHITANARSGEWGDGGVS